jgi:hypothetical protein
MFKKLFIFMSIITILFSGWSVYAYTENYSTSNYNQEQNWAENGSTYCGERKGLLSKIKSAFIGQPTGYTPQIPPSPYVNPYYGPSYQQGFYTGNRWNDHNAYYPQYPMRVYGLSF